MGAVCVQRSTSAAISRRDSSRREFLRIEEGVVDARRAYDECINTSDE
jgi:hypothetical protein